MRTSQKIWSMGLALLLQACGGGGAGGGGSGQLTGQFVDAPVEGLTYQCVTAGAAASTLTGSTNAQGQFSYLPGQACTFKVGSVIVGSLTGIPSDGLVTPQDVAGVARSATDAPSVAVIAQFLQSLSEPGTNGKIKISSAVATALAALPETRLVGSSGPIAQANLTQLVSSAGKTLVPAAQAASNLGAQMTSSGVSLTAGSVSASAPVTLNSVTVSAPASSIEAGALLKLTALANMSDGKSSVADSTVTWSTSDSTLATVAADGTVTTRKPGKVSITATKGSLSASMDVSVTDALLKSLSTAGLDDPLPLGATRTLSVVGTYSDGSEKTLSTGVNWTVANSNAKVDAQVLTASALGAVDVTATVGLVSQKFSLTISPAVLRSVAVSRVDGASTAVAAGRTVQLKAVGTYSDGSTQDISSAVSWSAGADNLAVGSGGLVTTSKAGSGRVTVVEATSKVTSTVSLDVSAATLASLAVTPAAPTVAQGLNQTLTLTGTYTDGTTSTALASVNWSSADANKVNVSSNGLVSGSQVGSVLVTATVGEVSTSVTFRVTDPVAQSLTLSAALTTISNGASTALNAVVTLTNGMTQAVASAVNWAVVSLGGQAIITTNGDTVTLKGTLAGDVRVTGSYQGVTGTLEMKILPTINGVAANGAAMSGAIVTVMDASGNTATVTANDDGSFVFTDMSGYKEPFQISATAQVGAKQVTQYSIYANALANGSNTINVTPLTSAIMALVAPNGVMGDVTTAQLASITPSQVSAVTAQVMQVIAPLVTSITDMPSSSAFNPITTTFVANGAGPDRLLDHLDVSVRPDGVAIANKMAMPSSDSSADTTSTLAKGSSGAPTPLAATDVVNLSGIEELVDKFKSCFAVSSTQRLTNKTTTSATLAPECAAVALPGYLHNGNNFMSRWAGLLNSTAMDSTMRFARPEIRLRISSNPEVIAMNLNMVDRDGVGYTLPELIQKQADGKWRLYGNQRQANAFVETSLINYVDMTPNTSYNNINYSHIETGLRFNFDPRVSFATDGTPTYHGIDLTQSGGYNTTNWSTIRNTGATMIKCVAVMGPGNFTSDGVKWMGLFPHGLLLKKPTSSARQDYMAIDKRMSQSQKTDLVNAVVGTTSLPNLCPSDSLGDGGFTASSSSTYGVDLQPKINQKHPITGQIDKTIDGRDVAFYTGARFARVSPDAALTAVFQNNPKFTYYVIDTSNVLRMKIDGRYLGELPSLPHFAAMVESNKLPSWTTASLQRYLDFSTTQNATDKVTAEWVNPVKGFNNDFANFYAEVYQSQPGQGLRSQGVTGQTSIYPANSANVGADGLWNSDSDLAAYIDAVPGTNFFWRYSGISKASDLSGNCTGNPLASTAGIGVYRGTTSLSSQALASNWLGTDTLSGACRKAQGNSTATPNAYLMREMSLRTYSDKNARMYNIVGNKKLQ